MDDRDTPRRLTRAQVIRELTRCGWTIEVEPRRSTLYATSPDGHRGYFDLRDLLAEVSTCPKCRRRHDGPCDPAQR